MKNIHDILQKIKSFFKERDKELFISALVIFIPLLMYGLIRLAIIKEEQYPVRVLITPSIIKEGAIREQKDTGSFVGSKNGTKYHYPWCSGAQRIQPANLIWFSSKKEAEAMGYTPAGNCPGL